MQCSSAVINKNAMEKQTRVPFSLHKQPYFTLIKVRANSLVIFFSFDVITRLYKNE